MAMALDLVLMRKETRSLLMKAVIACALLLCSHSTATLQSQAIPSVPSYTQHRKAT